jgi:ferredoxin
VLVLVAVAAGLAHASGALARLGPVSAMQVHVGAALVALPLLAWHAAARGGARPRRTDLSRRALLRAGVVAGGAGLLWLAVEGATRLARLPGAGRRFTGSLAVADPGRIPVTQWLDDRVQVLDPSAWRLRVTAGGSARDWTYDELAAYGDRVLVRPQDETGLLDLAGFLGDPRPGVRVYACGPAPLLSAVEAACAGWPPYTLRTERFVAVDGGAPARTAPFEVELARTGTTVTVTPEQTVLDALDRVGVEVLSSCRRGVCGTCETTVLAGRPDHRDALLDDDERAAGDCMYVCVSRSRDERLVLDL